MVAALSMAYVQSAFPLIFTLVIVQVLASILQTLGEEF